MEKIFGKSRVLNSNKDISHVIDVYYEKNIVDNWENNIMKSGFCVIRGFISMFDRGAYGSSLENKHIYRS